jgi:ABC-type amino acid transport substrate-binding protein
MYHNVVADFQNEIDRLKADGTVNKLYLQYLQQLNPPAVLQVYTEQYPPLTFRNGTGEITGFGTDLVNEIMKRNGTIYPINLTLWSNAMAMIMNNPNFCLFTMERIASRENLFNWVGPLGSNKTYFYVKTMVLILIRRICKNTYKNNGYSGYFNSYLGVRFLQIVRINPIIMVNMLRTAKSDESCLAITF